MEPHDVAALIRHHHADLRAMLDRLDELIDRSLADDVWATQQFFAHCRGLSGALLMHIDLEDTVIVPLLREHHPQGEAEALSLLRHHEAQRRWLTDVLSLHATPVGDTLVAVRALAHVLRSDMDHEDAQLAKLSPQRRSIWT